MSQYYDKSYKVPVWVVVNLADKKASSLVDQLTEKDGAYYQLWPSASFFDTVKEMGRNGWGHIVGKNRPYILDVGFLATAAVRHVKNCFGQNAILTGGNTTPYQQSINRKVEEDVDFVRMFDQVLALEPDTQLSQIFDLGSLKSKVFVSQAPYDRNTIARLAKRVITVGETDSDVNVKGKKTEEIYEAVTKELSKYL